VEKPPSDIYEDPEVRRGLQLYVELSRRKVREISAITEAIYRSIPAFQPMLRGLSGEQMVEQNAANIERIAGAAFGGDWGPYLESLRARGVSYARSGVRFTDWTTFFQKLLARVTDLIMEDCRGDEAKLRAMMKGTSSLMDTIVQVIGETFVGEQREIILGQQAALRELSTPILVVGQRVLLAPLIGDLDDARIHQLRTSMLSAVRAHRARVVVLDATGVAHVDTAVALRLGNAMKAARLMGARVLLSGLSSEIAQAMVLLGAELPVAEIFTTLQDALAEAFSGWVSARAAPPAPAPGSAPPPAPR
jgi:anti-anti-sigma regulatory factor